MNGTFAKGARPSPSTEFKNGQHWRVAQPFRESDWLKEHYVENGMSAGDIASMFDVTDSAIIFWLRKYGIKRRSVSEARGIKRWGQSGADNPMHGRTGDRNPRWMGGIAPERQTFYSSPAWKAAYDRVWARDGGKCRRCGASNDGKHCRKMHVHHIVSFHCKELRCDTGNLVVVCSKCHGFIHSKKNVNGEYIQKR
jgi:hypothetical protein